MNKLNIISQFVYMFIHIFSAFAHPEILSNNVTGLKTVYYFDNDLQQPLIADIYYPVNSTTLGSEPLGVLVRGLQAINAPLLESDQRFPLIVLSDGYRGSREYLSWLAEALCLQGYIVAAIDHFGNTAYFDIPKFALQRWLRPLAITNFLNFFLADSQWSHVVDQERIGFAGFSLGGLTGMWLAGGIADQFTAPVVGKSSIYELAIGATEQDVQSINYAEARKNYRDKRIKAAFLMAPAHGFSFSPQGLQSIDIPIHIVVGEADQVTPLAEHAQHYAQAISNAKLKILKGNISHPSFRNRIYPDRVKGINPHSFEVNPAVDVKKVHKVTSDLAIDFFKKHLKDR